MSISTAPLPPPPKKKGMGCLGCGCLVLVLLIILFLAVVASTSYVVYSKVVSLSTTTPIALPTFNGSEDLYRSTQQKLADFDHDVKNHQAATIRLSADEVNSLIAHSPDAIKNNIHAFVTLTDNEARVQANFPTDGLSHGAIKGRYFNFNVSFEVHFDPQIKSANLTFHTLQLGNKVLMGPTADSDQAASNQALARSFTPAFNQAFNNGIRQAPDGAALLNQAKSIEIKDGQLVIETQ